MVQIERILCPIDLSPRSDEALRYAIALARAFEAKLFICYFVQFMTMAESQAVEGALIESVASHIRQVNTGPLEWEVVVVVAEGDSPASAIIQKAIEKKTDLIVMQSRRRPRAAALLGSTAEAVCRTATCPVLVTHPREHEVAESAVGDIQLRRILVADDFSDYSARALSWGLLLAQEFQSELHLMHVLPPRGSVGLPKEVWTQPDGDGIVQMTINRLKNDVPEEAYLWCKIELAVREGRPDQEILAYAEEINADLICLGSHGEGQRREFLGSNADHVLRRAPCPVLVVRSTVQP